MTRYRKRYILPALLVMLVLSNVLFYTYNKIFQQVPYHNVQILDVHRDGDSIILRASFIKNGCEIRRFNIVGILPSGNDVEYLAWTDLSRNLPEPDPETSLYDRERGLHTVYGSFDLGGFVFDRVEIRTRHICPNGEVVDGIFTTIYPQNL